MTNVLTNITFGYRSAWRVAIGGRGLLALAEGPCEIENWENAFTVVASFPEPVMNERLTGLTNNVTTKIDDPHQVDKLVK